MKEVSNSTLALMVVAAIVVSLIGSFMSLSKLNQIGGVTGFATTATGKANLTVSAEATILIADDIIELGTIPINQTNTSIAKNDYWNITNDGGVNISIDIYATAQGGGTYINNKGIGDFETTTTINSGCINPTTRIHTCFMVNCNKTLSGYDCNKTFYSLNNESGLYKLLVDLDYHSPNDWALFGVNATVPIEEPAGAKEQSVTFLAASSE